MGKTRLTDEIVGRVGGAATTLSARARPLGGVASFVVDVHVYAARSAAQRHGATDVVAALVVRDPEHFDPHPLFTRLATRLGTRNVPDLLQIVDELPRTAAEKVRTGALSAALSAPRASVFRVRNEEDR